MKTRDDEFLESQTEPTEQTEQSFSKKVIMITIGVVILLIAGVVLYSYGNGLEKPRNDQADSSTLQINRPSSTLNAYDNNEPSLNEPSQMDSGSIIPESVDEIFFSSYGSGVFGIFSVKSDKSGYSALWTSDQLDYDKISVSELGRKVFLEDLSGGCYSKIS